MKTFHKVSLCLLFLSMQITVSATNKIHDKQLLQAYNILVKKPAQTTNTRKKSAAIKSITVNKTAGRSPQINATLAAKKQLNSKYRWGGSTPQTGFDCSGLMQYAYKASRVNIPRTAIEQYRFTKRVSMNNLKVGDLIFFHTRRSRTRVNHVGIYLGGEKFIHAPRRGKLVSISDLNSYWKKKVVGAGRV